MGKQTTTEPMSTFRLSAGNARNVLLARALEQEDREGVLVPVQWRRNATREAIAEHAHPKQWLALRARAIVERLHKTRPDLWRRLQSREIPLRWLAALLIPAFAFGLATNALGPNRAVNILAPPLVGLLLWNLAIYLWMSIRFLIPRRETADAPWWQRFSPLASGRASNSDDTGLEARIHRSFVGAWLPIAQPALAAGIRAAFHLGALMAVLGVIVGMYARGVAFEYRATWESTFLGVEVVDGFLATLLAPARAILDLDLPSAATIAAPASGPAAPWIHAWALIAGLGVGVPRLLLAGWDLLRIQLWRRRVAFDLQDSYIRRLEASVDTREEKVQILLYSYRATEKTLTTLRTLLLDLVGARAQIQTAPNLSYGDELPEAGGAGLRVAVFSAGQTPELEVHGEWLENLRNQRVDGQSLLVVIDESPFKKRLSDDSGGRIESRRRAWQRVLDHVELPVAFLELDQSETLSLHLENAAEALWPQRESRP